MLKGWGDLWGEGLRLWGGGTVLTQACSLVTTGLERKWLPEMGASVSPLCKSVQAGVLPHESILKVRGWHGYGGNSMRGHPRAG